MVDAPISRRTVLTGAFVIGGAAAVGVPAVLWAAEFRSRSSAGAQSNASRHAPAARPRELPTRFELARVCGHNSGDLMPYKAQKGPVTSDVYNRNAEAWSLLGARSTVRQVKSRDEDPWWPSSVPSSSAAYYARDRTNVVHLTTVNRRTGRYEDAGVERFHLTPGENLVSGWLAEANDHDVLMVAYYRYYNEYSLANGASSHGEPAHPSWVVKHQDGSTWMSSTGAWLDVTTPEYRDVVADRLVELAGYGVRAFYFDYLGLPAAEGPRGTATEAAYTKQTGDPPPIATPFTSVTSGAVKWRQFCANRLSDAYGIINSTLKASHSDAVFIASCTYLPGLTLPFHNTRMLGVIDCAKTEWGLAYEPALQDNVFEGDAGADCRPTSPTTSCTNPDLPRPHRETQRAMGWILLRDGANGRPFHCWVAGTASPEQAAAAAAGIIAYGGIASMLGSVDTLSRVLGSTGTSKPAANPRVGLETSFALSEVAGPYLANASPLRHIAVLYSEERRDAIGKGDAKVAWQRVLWPTLGGFEGFLKARIPVGIVNDSQLSIEGLNGYQALYVWDRSALSHAQSTVVDQFERSGGTVLEDPAAGRWATRDGNADAAKEMFDLALRHRSTSPVYVTGPPAGMRALPYSQSTAGVQRLVIAVVNEFSHVELTTAADSAARKQPNSPPAPVSDAAVWWQQSIQINGKRQTKPSAAYCVADDTPRRIALHYDTKANGLYYAELPQFQHLVLVIVEY